MYGGGVVRRWAYAYFTALDQYPGSLNDLDLDFIQTELSSERGKACGNPDAILHDEDFQLSARKYIRSNAYRRVHRTSRLRCSANGSVIVLV